MSTLKSKTLSYILKITGLVGSAYGSYFLYSELNNDHDFYKYFVMPMMRKLDAELSHDLGVLFLKYNMLICPWNPDINKKLKTELLDIKFDNCIGMAAGFDKNGQCFNGMGKLGFGFVEIGTITIDEQYGNEKPRLFRLSEDKALINRYGFNNQGMKKVINNIVNNKRSKQIPLGINIGINKNETDFAEAYKNCSSGLAPFADYIVINVSSPNTFGLRDLQKYNSLEKILVNMHEELEIFRALTSRRIPIFIKISPDISKEDLEELVRVFKELKKYVSGVIISNTTITRSSDLTSTNKDEVGGLSGAPLKDISNDLIGKFYCLTEGKIPIIGVGGIFSGRDAFDKIVHGASLVQIYSSFVIEGPIVVRRIQSELLQILEEEGFKNVNEAVGNKFKKT